MPQKRLYKNEVKPIESIQPIFEDYYKATVIKAARS